MQDRLRSNVVQYPATLEAWWLTDLLLPAGGPQARLADNLIDIEHVISSLLIKSSAASSLFR